MIRGAGRLKRMDERANWPEPRDAVRDGRHLMPQDQDFGHARFVRVPGLYGIVSFGPEWFQIPSDAEVARMEDEGGPPC